MGYHSQLAIEKSEELRFDRERGHLWQGVSERREFLEYHLEILNAKLKHLEMCRPRDPLSWDYDRLFYSDVRRRYYEDPETVQDILSGISEIKDRLWALSCSEREEAAERIRLAEMKDLGENLGEQILMVSYWDYAAFFKEADAYRKLLSVLKQ